MLSQIFTAAILALSAQSALAASCSRKYTIKEGDYCDKISAAQNVSTFQLAAVNSGLINSKCTNLVPNSELCLGNTGEDCQTTYVVKSGDTCGAIASGAGTNSTILFLNNPQIDEKCENIYVGEVLCIGEKVQVPVIPAGGVVVPVSGPPANPPPAGDNKPAPTAITVTGASKPLATPAPPPANVAAPPPAANDDDNCDDDDSGDANGGDDNVDDGDCDADDGLNGDDDADLPYCDEI